MKFYRFSPIKSKEELLKAIEYIHFSCYELCKQSFGEYLSNSGNLGVFCHYDDEHEFLTKLRQEMTDFSDNVNQKYYRLHEPVTIPAKGDVPETTYTYLYIRQPDPYRSQVGDVDFYLPQEKYDKVRQSLLDGKKIKGARMFPRNDLDMIELYNPDVDCCGYVSAKSMTEKVRTQQPAVSYSMHHVALSVSNLEKSQTFYEQFGFREVSTWEPDDNSFKISNLRNGNMMLELFCYVDPRPLPKHSKDLWQDLPVLGVKHFALHVSSIDEAKNKLQREGLGILNEDINEDHSGANYFFVRDPDGILVEIIEDNRKV